MERIIIPGGSSRGESKDYKRGLHDRLESVVNRRSSPPRSYLLNANNETCVSRLCGRCENVLLETRRHVELTSFPFFYRAVKPIG